MLTDQPNSESSTDSPPVIDGLVAQLARSFIVGTDTEGNTHHYYQPADTVVVYDGRTLEHVESLNGRPLKEWTAYIRDHDDLTWRSKGPHASLGIGVDAHRKNAGGA